jgi:hypothetical protein
MFVSTGGNGGHGGNGGNVFAEEIRENSCGFVGERKSGILFHRSARRKLGNREDTPIASAAFVTFCGKEDLSDQPSLNSTLGFLRALL